MPDVQNKRTVLVEEEYFRNPHSRFGPARLSKVDRSPMPRLQVRAKLLQMDIPIFVPTIEDHLNAYLDQRRTEIDTGVFNGGFPEWQIHNFIRYLYLDWSPTREWLMGTKIRERNRELMGTRIDNYRRKLLVLWRESGPCSERISLRQDALGTNHSDMSKESRHKSFGN